jgi:hypothetical protein
MEFCAVSEDLVPSMGKARIQSFKPCGKSIQLGRTAPEVRFPGLNPCAHFEAFKGKRELIAISAMNGSNSGRLMFRDRPAKPKWLKRKPKCAEG